MRQLHCHNIYNCHTFLKKGPLVILAIFMQLSMPAYAQNASTSYIRAYKYCSPTAHKATMEQCSYTKMVETIYMACMSNSGYGEDSQIVGQKAYDAYLKTHTICSNSANSNAQKECDYGNNYKTNYNKCMEELGFDANGNEINNDPTNPKDEKGLNRRARKFFDLIL